MFRTISPKALLLSNIAHWLFFGAGFILAMVFYCAVATLASDGTPDLKAIFDNMKTSGVMMGATVCVCLVAPIPAGYIAAKIAPREKLLHGALSTSAWLLFCVYEAIWGGNQDDGQFPHWVDAMISWGIPVPGMIGAYIWHVRADRRSLAAGDIAVPRQTERPATTAQSTQTLSKRSSRIGAALGTFIFIISELLLTKHERDVLFVAVVAMIGLALLAALVNKLLKGFRP
jgi:hypothetical protein